MFCKGQKPISGAELLMPNPHKPVCKSLEIVGAHCTSEPQSPSPAGTADRGLPRQSTRPAQHSVGPSGSSSERMGWMKEQYLRYRCHLEFVRADRDSLE
jgi:hypothetical protein